MYSVNGGPCSVSEQNNGAWMGQKSLFWDAMGHGWDILTHMNLTEFHMEASYNALINLKKTHALGRSLVILKITASRS